MNLSQSCFSFTSNRLVCHRVCLPLCSSESIEDPSNDVPVFQDFFSRVVSGGNTEVRDKVHHAFSSILNSVSDEDASLADTTAVDDVIDDLSGPNSSFLNSLLSDINADVSRRPLLIALVMTLVMTLIPFREAIAQGIENKLMSLDEFKERLMKLITEFVYSHKHEILDAAMPVLPEHDSVDFTDEEQKELEEMANHHGFEMRRSFTDDPMAIPGRELLSFAGSTVAFGTFMHAIFTKFMREEPINVKYYILMIAGLGTMFYAGGDEKRDHMLHEWQNGIASFVVMVLSAALFNGEYYEGVDFKRYSYEQICFSSTLLGSLVAPLNTTLGVSTINAPILKEMRKRWMEEQGMTEEELNIHSYRQMTFDPNIHGALGIGDYPWIKVTIEQWKGVLSFPTQLLAWQTEGGVGSKSLVDEWLFAAASKMFQLAPKYVGMGDSRRKTSAFEKAQWAIAQGLDKDNWKCFMELLDSLVPMRSLQELPPFCKNIIQRCATYFNADTAHRIAHPKDITSRFFDDMIKFTRPLAECGGNLVELTAAIASTDVAELTRTALQEPFQQKKISDAYSAVYEKGIMTDDDKGAFWDTLLRKVRYYDSTERPVGIAHYHSLCDIVRDEVRPAVEAECKQCTFEQYVDFTIKKLEETVERAVDPVNEPYEVRHMETYGINYVRLAANKRVLDTDAFWIAFAQEVYPSGDTEDDEKERHHFDEMIHHMEHFTDAISMGLLKVRPVLSQLADETIAFSPHLEVKIKTILTNCKIDHYERSAEVRLARLLKKVRRGDVLIPLSVNAWENLLSNENLPSTRFVAQDLHRLAQTGDKLRLTKSLKKTLRSAVSQQANGTATLQSLAKLACDGEFSIRGTEFRKLCNIFSDHADFHSIKPMSDMVHSMITGELRLDEKNRATIARALRDNQLSVACSTMAEAMTNMALSDDIPNRSGKGWLVRMKSFAYFFDPQYSHHRLAPLFGLTIAEMVGVLLLQMMAIIPIVDFTSRADVYLDKLEPITGKVRARVYYGASIDMFTSAFAENLSGFWAAVDLMKNLLGPMIGKDPSTITIDDPDLKPFFSALYMKAIIAGHSNLLGDFAPQMAFFNQIAKKGVFPKVGASAKGNWPNTAVGLTYQFAFLELGGVIKEFEAKVEAYEKGKDIADLRKPEVSERVFDALVVSYLEQLKDHVAGKELSEVTQSLIDKFMVFTLDRDAALHDAMVQRMKEIDPASLVKEHQFDVNALIEMDHHEDEHRGVAPVTTKTTVESGH